MDIAVIDVRGGIIIGTKDDSPMSDSAVQRPWAEDLAEAREVAARLHASLPSQIEVAALGVRSKAPYQLLVIREALIWRTEELARNACEALEKEDFAVVALLARAIAERAALIWYLVKILEERAEYTPDQLNDKLMQLLVGMKWKMDKATEPDTYDLPEAINVATFVKHVNRVLPGFDEAYNLLSEFAHPNWLGVVGLYSKHDPENFRTEFGRGLYVQRGSRLAHALDRYRACSVVPVAGILFSFEVEVTPLSGRRHGRGYRDRR